MARLSTSYVRALGLALGFAVLCLLLQINPLISFSHEMVYHFDGSPTYLFAPVLIDIAVLWAVVAGLLTMRAGRVRASILSGILLMLPWIALKQLSVLADAGQHGLRHYYSLPLACLPLLGVVAINLVWSRPLARARVERMLARGESVLLWLSIMGAITVAQLLFCFVAATGLNRPAALHQATGAGLKAGHPKRVIVLLFDELSYAQTYGKRSSRVSLPGFDRLKSEAAVFTDVRPAAEYTERAIPSILSGREADELRASADGRRVQMRGPGGWVRLDPWDTVFGDALRDGYSTGVAGWYNPYCRIMPQVLDRCAWFAHSSDTLVTNATGAPYSRNVIGDSLLPVKTVAGDVPGFLFPHWRDVEAATSSPEHRLDYQRITASADALLNDPAMTFVFVHLPIPHSDGIYDRHTGRAPAHGMPSYLDNLALADAWLAHAEDLLKRRGDWDDSVVMVLGDHSWRISLWSATSAWTKEDAEVAAAVPWDDRPVTVVKPAHSTGGLWIDSAFDAKHTRLLLDRMMAGDIRTEADLAHWVIAGAR